MEGRAVGRDKKGKFGAQEAEQRSSQCLLLMCRYFKTSMAVLPLYWQRRDGCEFGVILGGTVRSRREKQPTRQNRGLRRKSLRSIAQHMLDFVFVVRHLKRDEQTIQHQLYQDRVQRRRKQQFDQERDDRNTAHEAKPKSNLIATE